MRSAVEAVGWLVAAQAQDYAGSKWALGLRASGVRDEDVERALNSGAILRTHLLRPTWHFVTATDIRGLLALSAPRVHAANAYMYRKLSLDAKTLAKCIRVIQRRLEGENALTREDVRDALATERIEVDAEMRMGYIMMFAELEALVCSGPRRGKQSTYALLDERVPLETPRDADDVLSNLARRYFVSRGPATVHDFAKWSGLTVAQAKHGLTLARSDLARDTIDGSEYWLAPNARGRSESSAHLLSIYDEYVSSYKDRSAIGTAEDGKRLSAMGNALTSIILIDGRIRGTWKRTLDSSSVRVTLEPFARLTKRERDALASEVDRLGQFLGLSASIMP